MAIIDTLRFRNILVNGNIAEEAPAEEFEAALDESFEEATFNLATKQVMAQMQSEILQAMAAMEARLQRQMLFSEGIIVAAVAAAATLLAVFG